MDPVNVLQRIVEATEALEATLDPFDVGAFEQALAARSEALEALKAQAIQAQDPSLLESMRGLADAAAEADRRVRGRAALALASLREELRSLDTGRQGLVGYRQPAPNLPRFADRRG